MRPFRFRMPATAAAVALLVPAMLAEPAAAQSAGSILIWPVNPVIEGDAQASALWLENPGRAPVTLQVRIYAWAQQDGQNAYAAQDEILGTPPIITIEPGVRQLVRLTRLTPPPVVPEKPYRIVVDEIPKVLPADATGASVGFRMRYSLPLFSYAKSPESGKKKALPPPPPLLGWRTGTDAKGRFLEIRNSGSGHARLTDVAFVRNGNRSKVAEGLFGYVLPGATMRWPLPAAVDPTGDLVATTNGEAGPPIERLPG